MKWIYIFLIGALVGAFSIFDYLKSTTPDAAPATSSVTIALAAMRAPSNPHPAHLAAAPASAAIAQEADNLLIPVADINASQLNDTFDEARGSKRRHEAIDILAPKGTQVLAVANGKVAKLFDSKPGGLTIYQFDTNEKFAYYYAHLDRYASGIKEGTVLKRGDLVGYVGATGNADQATPHLHFAIFELGPDKQWWKGRPINPYPLLGGAKHP